LYGSTVVNNGTVVWDGGTSIATATPLYNNGHLAGRTDDQFYNGSGGNPTFYNYGTFTKSPPRGDNV